MGGCRTSLFPCAPAEAPCPHISPPSYRPPRVRRESCRRTGATRPPFNHTTFRPGGTPLRPRDVQEKTARGRPRFPPLSRQLPARETKAGADRAPRNGAGTVLGGASRLTLAEGTTGALPDTRVPPTIMSGACRPGNIYSEEMFRPYEAKRGKARVGGVGGLGRPLIDHLKPKMLSKRP